MHIGGIKKTHQTPHLKTISRILGKSRYDPLGGCRCLSTPAREGFGYSPCPIYSSLPIYRTATAACYADGALISLRFRISKNCIRFQWDWYMKLCFACLASIIFNFYSWLFIAAYIRWKNCRYFIACMVRWGQLIGSMPGAGSNRILPAHERTVTACNTQRNIDRRCCLRVSVCFWLLLSGATIWL